MKIALELLLNVLIRVIKVLKNIKNQINLNNKPYFGRKIGTIIKNVDIQNIIR